MTSSSEEGEMEDAGERVTTLSESDLESESELHQCSTTARMDYETRQELRERGIVVREGMWTGLEDRRLKDNMELICKKYRIDEARKIMYPQEYPDSADMRKLIQEEKLLIKLGKGIQRPIYNVYIRARKIFDPKNYLGRFSSEEVQEMKALTRQFGTRWSKIGREMGRSGRSLCDKFKISGAGYACGNWSEAEKEKLVKVVKQVSGFNRDRNVERLYFKIPWTTVSERMETRNVAQCRTQWVDILSWAAAEYTDRETSRRTWDMADKISLIQRVYKMDVNSEQDIDWLALLDQFPSVPSPQKLSSYWHRLKVQYVSDYHFKTFEDNLGVLHSKVLPQLQRKMANEGLQNKGPEFVDASDDDSDAHGRRRANSRKTKGGKRRHDKENAEDRGNRRTVAEARVAQEAGEDSGVASTLPSNTDHPDSDHRDTDHQAHQEMRRRKKKKRRKRNSDEGDEQEQLVARESDADVGDTNSSVESGDIFQPDEPTQTVRSNEGAGCDDEVHERKRKKKKHKHREHHDNESDAALVGGDDDQVTSESMESLNDGTRHVTLEGDVGSSYRLQKKKRKRDRSTIGDN